MSRYTFDKEPSEKQLKEIIALLFDVDDCIKVGDEPGMKINLAMLQGYLIGSEIIPITSNLHLGDAEAYKWILDHITQPTSKEWEGK